MAAIELIREQVIGFDEQTGQSVNREQYFIKLQVDFERFIATFKEVQLKFFMSVALHEAKIHLRGELPLTVREVSARAQTSLRASKSAAYFLLKHNFIVKAGVRAHDQPDRGAIMYRVSSYAWFGAGNEPPTISRGVQNLHTLDSIQPVQNLHTPIAVQNPARGVQISTEGVQNPARALCKKTRRGMQNDARPVQNSDNHIVIVDVVQNKSVRQKQKQALSKNANAQPLDLDAQKARDAFRSFGIGGVNLRKLAETISPVIAEEWALCARHTDIEPRAFQGICFNSLNADPTAPPPCSPAELDEWRMEEQQSVERVAAQLDGDSQPAATVIAPALSAEMFAEQAQRAARELSSLNTANPAHIWQATLGELQLQMTKATFDTWVKPTFAFALSYEDEDAAAHLTVAVRNAYAKQWLENRLLGMVERALQHVLGQPTRVSFVLKTGVDSNG